MCSHLWHAACHIGPAWNCQEAHVKFGTDEGPQLKSTQLFDGQRSPSKDIESVRVSGLGVKQLARFSGQKIHSPALQFRGSGILGASLGRPSRRWHARQLSESVWPIVLCRSFDQGIMPHCIQPEVREARGAIDCSAFTVSSSIFFIAK